METAAAKELAKQARAGYLLLADGKEIAEECKQSHSLGKLRHIARHLPQQRHGIIFHHAEFKH